MAKAKGKRNRRKEKLEFVQDYLPIRDLKNGIIETTDNRYIKILEIEPINFTLRSDEEQFNIISSFASWLKISPMRLQFKSITRRADSDKHISMICEELEHEENPQCKELGEDYIGLIKDVGNREALTRRFFLIFQYEAVGRNESDDYAKIYGMLQTAEQTARAYFMQCGNSIVQSKDPDEATAEILYMFYNRRSCTDEPFSSRVDRIVVDTMAAKKKIIGMDPVPPIRMANFLAPRGMLGSFLIATTSVSKFLAAITKLRLSKGLTIALAVTLRYFPTMREEWASIRDAMALRGISASAAGLISHPIQTMEHVYVPLLVSASRISDEITQAAITRGIEHTGERSCIEEIAFSFADLLVVIAYAALVAGMVYAGMKGVF